MNNNENPFETPRDKNKEVELSSDQLTWLAGLFESGGSFNFQVLTSPRGNTFSAEPSMYIGSRNTKVLHALHELLGGRIVKEGVNNKWILTGQKAANVMLQLKDLTPSRVEMRDALETWETIDEKDLRSKVELSGTLRGIDRFKNLSPADYAEVVKSPAFLAGVLDSRGSVSKQLTEGRQYPFIQIISKNKALLDALALTYGGVVKISTKAGTVVKVNTEQKRVTKKDSYLLVISSEQARAALTTSKQFAKNTFFEGWETKTPHKKLENIEHQTSELQALIEDLDEQDKRGELTHLPTHDEIGEKLGMKSKRVGDRLKLLPEEVRTKWNNLKKKFSRRVLNENEARVIANFVADEVRRYEAGEISQITDNKTLAAQNNIGAHIVDRNITSMLPSETREKRRLILNNLAQKHAAELRKNNRDNES